MLIKVLNKRAHSCLKTAYLFTQKLELCGSFFSGTKVWSKRISMTLKVLPYLFSTKKTQINRMLFCCCCLNSLNTILGKQLVINISARCHDIERFNMKTPQTKFHFEYKCHRFSSLHKNITIHKFDE